MLPRQAMLRMIISRQFVLLVMAVGMIVLARQLGPADFGTFAVGIALFTLLDTLADFGLSSWLIRAESLGRDEVRAAAGLTVAIAAGLFGLTMAICVLVPATIWPEDLRGVVMVLTFGLLARPFIMPAETLLRREMQFDLLSVLAVLRVLADVGLAILLALAGFGPVALAVGLLADRVVAIAVLNRVRARRVMPSASGWGRFMAFSRPFTIANILPKLTDLGIVALLQGALGMAALGLYNRARTIVGLLDKSLIEGIAPVVLPAFARALADGVSPGRIYEVKVSHLSVVFWPVFAAVALLASPLIAVLLGPQWEAAVPVTQLLCLTGIFLPTTAMGMKLFAALDRMPAFLRIQAQFQALRLALVALGALHSLEAVAAALVLAKAVQAMLIGRDLRLIVADSRHAVRRACLRSAVVTLMVLAAAAAVLLAAPGLSPLATLGLAMAACAVAWLAGIALTRHPIGPQILGALRLGAA